ncbi:hypothetical protein BDP27DRAFT_1403125 [Rhodocollybia butyracea]|uniref:Uncharacterized protein n=1 Tax=Rhodocollybia butyracea TaxID=206335 RepID=A0A9P5PMK2_9AGAR|nr:hypothetical protein BDP27DRAFT_1403125 [Rhodocollybia butyracea]
MITGELSGFHLSTSMSAKGALSEPDHRGRTWLQLDDTCKIMLSATETQKYMEWRESFTRDSDSTGKSSVEDPTETFFRTLATSSAPTSLEGSTRSGSPALKESKKVQRARVQLYEDQYILDHAPTRLRTGQIDIPDSFGWRWYQCTEDVQVLLPPDVATQYMSFLMVEEFHLNSATSCRTVEKFNKARRAFNDLCLQSKSRHPVRGIMSTHRRYALPVGFRCSSIDKLVGRPQDDSKFLPEHMQSSKELLSEPDEYWRRWVCVEDGIRVLLPADTAAQLAFLRRTGVSQASHPLMQRILTDFRCLSFEISPEQLRTPEKLCMFPSESRSQTLDEAVAHIEVNISRSARKHVKYTTLNPWWRGVIHELGEVVDFPPSRDPPREEQEYPEKSSPGVVRRVARRPGRRNLLLNQDKQLPPLPPEISELELNRDNSRPVSEKLWLHRKVLV